MDTSTDHWPTDITLNKAKDTLSVDFDNGERFQIAAELLRVRSPSAEVQGHGGQGAVLEHGKSGVKITNITPIGSYAVKITFSDGHDTGLFTWSFLYEHGENGAAIFSTYQDELKAAGLIR